MAADARPLEGRGIVVTRPRAQAETLAALLRAAGGTPLMFPAPEIRDLPELGPILALVDRLDVIAPHQSEDVGEQTQFFVTGGRRTSDAGSCRRQDHRRKLR